MYSEHRSKTKTTMTTDQSAFCQQSCTE